MHFIGKTGIFIHMFMSLNDNSKVIDLERVHSPPQAKHTKMHCILQVDEAKEANILLVLVSKV